MATHHRGTGQLMEANAQSQEDDIDTIHDLWEEIDEKTHEETNNLEYGEHEHAHHTRFRDSKHKLNSTSNDPTETIHGLECELQRLTLSLHPSAPPEPLDEILNQYTETLCTAQQKTTLTNTLLQDISIFNGNDSPQLEDWIMDIETAAELTNESRTKLAQAKSKGLTCTLISEAITLNKGWEEIKDLLHVKLCNSDTYTSVSQFMEIQQKDNESLAAYLHRFKRETKRCHFDNNAATLQIFLKGLRMLIP